MFNRRRTEDEAEGRPGMGDQGSAPRSAAEPETGAPADAEAEAGAGPNQAGAPESEESRERYLRLLADFQNYQRRALGNEREARVQGATGVLTSILPVLDNFDLALAQDPQSVTVQQMLEGSRAIRASLVRALEAHGVSILAPEPGAEFDPTRHQAIMHQAREGVAPGHVVATLQAGYMLGDRVIRPAKVSVAPSE